MSLGKAQKNLKIVQENNPFKTLGATLRFDRIKDRIDRNLYLWVLSGRHSHQVQFQMLTYHWIGLLVLMEPLSPSYRIDFSEFWTN